VYFPGGNLAGSVGIDGVGLHLTDHRFGSRYFVVGGLDLIDGPLRPWPTSFSPQPDAEPPDRPDIRGWRRPVRAPFGARIVFNLGIFPCREGRGYVRAGRRFLLQLSSVTGLLSDEIPEPPDGAGDGDGDGMPACWWTESMWWCHYQAAEPIRRHLYGPFWICK